MRAIHFRTAHPFIWLPLLLGATASVTAQTAIEEVVVTAQKREQSIQDVGISVTAFSGDQVRELGYTSTADVAAQSPGVTINQFHPSITNITIRGVSQNDFADHLEPPVAVYSDEAYIASMGAAATQMFDMERIEVLRGPQGTLFGRNATGGLLHFISRKPTDAAEGYGELTFGEFDQIKFEGAVGGPLTETVRGRVAVATNYHDGYIENRIGKDLRGDESYAVRGQLEYDLTDVVTVLGKLTYSTTDTVGNTYSWKALKPNAELQGEPVGPNENFWGTCPGCDLAGFREPDNDPFTASIEDPGFFERDILGGNLHITWQLSDAVTLTSITDYLTINKDYREDTEGSPIQQFDFTTGQQTDQFSQELRFNGDLDTWRWVAGFYYLDLTGDYTSSVTLGIDNLFGAPPGLKFIPLGDWELSTESWALFGQAEYDFTPEWTGILGVRYTEDDKKQDYRVTDNFGDLFILDDATFPDIASQGWENVSVRAELDWRPNEDLLMYASFNRGHKGGNWAAPIFLPPPGPARDAFVPTLAHDEEVLHSFEVGFKSTLMDGAARLNGSVFYYDYSDYQAFGLVGGLAQAIGNNDAEAWGGELELYANPWEGWDFIFGLAALDSEVKDVTLPDGSVDDREFPLAPGLELNGLARYSWAGFYNGTMALQADFNWQDDVCFTVVCHPYEEEGSYIVGNLRASWTSGDEKWQAAAFVHNVADAEYRVYALDISGLGFGNDTFGAPRWVGGSISYKWQ